MTVLEITVQRGSGGAWPVVVEHSRPDALSPIRKEGELRLGDDKQRRLIELELDPRAYGEVLGGTLFAGPTREAFRLAKTRDPDGLRVRLFVEDKELQRLYWGRLCEPVDDDIWDFLARDQRSTFALYLPSSTDLAYRPIGQRDLRALLVVAEPEGLSSYGLAEFNAAATVASLRAALGTIPCEVLAAVPGADGLPTLDELCRRLGDGQHTLLHVVAHGQVRDGETYLFLANERNQVERAAGEALIRELRRLAQLPHFIFLATCHSAQPMAGLGGLAQRLVIQLGVPAAVAMTEAVTIDTAGALAAAFYAQLRASGEPDVALARACAGLTRRPDITVPALYSRLGDRPLFSDTLDRELTPAEVAAGLNRLEALLPERAPVLVSDFKQSANRLRGMLSAGRANLAEAARPEWDKAWAAISKTCDEVLEINFRAFALGHEPLPYDARCPFPGLLAFGARYAASGNPKEDDRSFFFGREALVEQLEHKLGEHRFLPVLGASGCGKSSVVLAGLAPRLQDRGLRMAYMTPGNDPVAHLEARLAGISDSSQAFLVVDQFEELFTLVDRDEQRRIFLDRLLSLAGRVPVVITMRADFLGDCAPYTALAEALVPKMKLVAPMTTVELRSAMEQQASAVGLRFEADLSNTILDAVKNEPGAMPLLQHLLNELWQHRHGRWLLGSEYRAVGGIQQAIAETADRVYNDLTPADQGQVRDIFLRLTRLDEDVVQGEERRDSRRRVDMEELVTPGRSCEGTKALVKRLADSRLVVASVNTDTKVEEVEVAHEALIRYWPSLRTWLDADRELLRLREGIRRAAWEWQSSQQDESYLVHRGKRLQSAQALLAHPRITLNQRETAYIHACVAAETASRPIGTEPISWEAIVDRLRRGRFVPILGSWLDFELAVGVSEELLSTGYSEFIQYSLPGPYRLASLIDHQRAMQDVRHYVNEGFLDFVKNMIYWNAARDGLDRDTLDEAEAQVDQMNVTQFARLLGYPRFEKGPEDLLLLLANMPFKTILTTSPFTFIEDSLRRAGKEPRTELCRWRKDLHAIPPAVDSGYQPSKEEPLVYHLWGLDQYPDSLVLSEDDYLGYLIEVAMMPEIVPPVVRRSLAGSSLLLLGQDLDDLPWRVLDHAILQGRSAQLSSGSVFQLRPVAETKKRELVDAYLRRSGFMPFWGMPGDLVTQLLER